MRQYFDTKDKPWLVWVGFALIGLSLALLPFALVAGRAPPGCASPTTPSCT